MRSVERKMTAELEGLAACKEALEKGLILQEDYDKAKGAFLRCQQLAMGFKTGIVGESDVGEAKVSWNFPDGRPSLREIETPN